MIKKGFIYLGKGEMPSFENFEPLYHANESIKTWNLVEHDGNVGFLITYPKGVTPEDKYLMTAYLSERKRKIVELGEPLDNEKEGKLLDSLQNWLRNSPPKLHSD